MGEGGWDFNSDTIEGWIATLLGDPFNVGTLENYPWHSTLSIDLNGERQVTEAGR